MFGQSRPLRLARSVLLAFITLASVSIQARAQDSARWTDPSGRFSLAFADLGWSGPPAPPGETQYLLAVQNPSLPSSLCAVRRAPPAQAQAGLPQEAVNTLTTRLTERQLQTFHHTNAPVRNLTFLDIGGVAVADYVIETSIWQHWRTFWLLHGDQAVMYEIACTARTPVSAEERSGAAAFLDTLHFND
ncbi:hypothetical protein [Terricaulis sp.]|uniref:hypothetical protein n=1 Tax=Terricaulis sp. TaxID=2768686 RepID=UPI003783FCF0